MIRTIYCGDVTEEYIGKEVTLCGWVKTIRDLGSLIFIELRDRSGYVQVVIDNKNKEVFDKAKKVGVEYVLKVNGKVRERPKENINEKIPQCFLFDISSLLKNFLLSHKALHIKLLLLIDQSSI